jgi:hypothetical protein
MTRKINRVLKMHDPEDKIGSEEIPGSGSFAFAILLQFFR